MSHMIKMKTQFVDHNALRAACSALGLEVEQAEAGKNKLFPLYDRHASGQMGIHLPGWRYPLVIQDKQAFYDNMGGQWGDISELTKLEDAYLRQVTYDFAAAEGYTITQTVHENGRTEIELVQSSW